jgi:hypothetical protein
MVWVIELRIILVRWRVRQLPFLGILHAIVHVSPAVIINARLSQRYQQLLQMTQTTFLRLMLLEKIAEVWMT